MELNGKCQIDAVPQNPPKRPRNKISFRKILLSCGIGICVISSVFSVFRDSAVEHNRRGLAHYKWGETYNLKGENEKAIADCTKAIELAPGLAEAYNNRGLAYFSEKEFSKEIIGANKVSF